VLTGQSACIWVWVWEAGSWADERQKWGCLCMPIYLGRTASFDIKLFVFCVCLITVSGKHGTSSIFGITLTKFTDFCKFWHNDNCDL